MRGERSSAGAPRVLALPTPRSQTPCRRTATGRQCGARAGVIDEDCMGPSHIFTRALSRARVASAPSLLFAYGALSELVTPLAAAAAYRRGGPQAAKHALALAEPCRPSASYLLWVHGASVGETCSALPLVRALLASDAKAAVVLTASTPGALARLQMEDLGPRVLLRQRPHDSATVMQRFLSHWEPDGLVLMESELWPILLTQCRLAGVPIALVNARLSARSLGRWTAFAPALLRTLLGCCAVVLAQSARMAQQLQNAATPDGPAGDRLPPSIVYCGDLKRLPGALNAASSARVTEELTVALGERLRDGHVWLAASTHEGEEAVVLRVHAALRRNGHDRLLLLLVPRHPERGPHVAEVAARHFAAESVARAVGAPCESPVVARRSTGDAVTAATAVYVCDTLGELPVLYGLAGVAFVGGSLVPLGGHSILEAARASGGCTVLHGPYIEAISDAATALAEGSPAAARCVRDAVEMQDALEPLLSDAALRRASRSAAAHKAIELEAGVFECVWAELQNALGLPSLQTRAA